MDWNAVGSPAGAIDDPAWGSSAPAATGAAAASTGAGVNPYDVLTAPAAATPGAPGVGGAPLSYDPNDPGPVSRDGVPLAPLILRLEGSGQHAVSPMGAVGNYQIMPETAREYGFDPSRLQDPAYNRQAGLTIIDDLNRKYGGDADAVVVKYNASTKAFNRWLAAGRDPSVLPVETQKYLAHAHALMGIEPAATPAVAAAPAQSGWDAVGAPGGASPWDAVGTPAGDPAWDKVGTAAGATPATPPTPTNPIEKGFRDVAAGAVEAFGQIVHGFGQSEDVAGQRIQQQTAGGYNTDPESGITVTVSPQAQAQAQAQLQAGKVETSGAQATAPFSAAMSAQAKALSPWKKGLLGNIAVGGGAMAPGLVAAVANLPAGAAVFYAQGFNQAHDEAIAKGADEQTASRAGVMNGLAQAGITAIPGGKIISAALKPAVRLAPKLVQVGVDVASHAGGTGVVMGAAQAGSNAVAAANYDPTRPLLQGVPEAAVEGAAMGGGFHVGGEAFGAAKRFVGERLRPREGVQPTAAAPATPMPDTGAVQAYAGGAWDAVGTPAPGEHVPTPEAVAPAGNPAEWTPAQEAAFQAQHAEPVAEPPPTAINPDTGTPFKTENAQVVHLIGQSLPGEFEAAQADVNEYRSAAPKDYGIFAAIKDLGGMRVKEPDGSATPGPDVQGALEDVKRKPPGMINNKSGMSPEQMHEALQEQGWFGQGNVGDEALVDAIRQEATGEKFTHPDSDSAQQLARRHLLDNDMSQAGVTPADSPDLAAAKLAQWRSEQITQGSLQMETLRARADALGVAHDAAMTHDELLGDVLEREAIRGEGTHEGAGDYERQIDQHLTPDDLARLDEYAREGLSPEHGEGGHAFPLPEGWEHEPPTPEGYSESAPGAEGGGAHEAPSAAEAAAALKPSASWVVVDRATGKPVLETFEQKTAQRVNRDRYEVLTAHDWLARHNAAVKDAGGHEPVSAAEAATASEKDRKAKGRLAFQEMQRQLRAREARAKEIGDAGRAVRLTHPDGRSVLAGPDMSKPGWFRLTRFDKEGEPTGHEEYKTLEQAAFEGLNRGFEEPGTTERLKLAGETADQHVMPGMERSARQAAAAREGPLRAKVGQDEPGGMFAEPEPQSHEMFGEHEAVSAADVVDPKFQRAFHGTPHDFDEFHTSRIGTGEGAQSFGHGLYFAGNKAVAEYYRGMLAGPPTVKVNGIDSLNFVERDVDALRKEAAKIPLDLKPIDGATKEQMRKAKASFGWTSLAAVVNGLRREHGTADERLDAVAERARREAASDPDLRERVSAEMTAAYAEALKKMGAVKVERPGHIHEVEIPDDHEYLDWFKPLHEQSPQVLEGLKKLGIEPLPAPEKPQNLTVAAIVSKALREADGDPSQVGLIVDNDHDLYTRASALAERLGHDMEDGAGAFIEEMAKPYLDGLAARRAQTGEEAYHQLAERFAPPPTDEGNGWNVAAPERPGNAKAAADALSEAGIAGTRYEDAFSRTYGGDGTHNYVVFDHARIKTLAKMQRPEGSAALRVHAAVSAEALGETTGKERALLGRVAEEVDRIAPFAEAHAFRSITESTGGEPEAVHGMAYRDGLRHIIGWSLDSADPIATARHEAVHALRSAGLFKPEEWEALSREAVSEDWIGRYHIDQRYPDLTPEQRIEEAVAERFSEWNRAGPGSLPEIVRTAFAKVRQVLARIADVARQVMGKDVTASDVLSRIESGDVGSRMAGADQGDRVAFARKPVTEEDQNRGPRGIVNRTLGRGVESVGRKLQVAAERSIPDPAAGILDEIKMGVSPMGMGSTRAQAAAKDFANALRQSAFQWGKLDEWLVKNFDHDARQRMWNAADEHGVLLRRGVDPGEGQGLNKLSPKERETVLALQERADAAFAQAQKLGMTAGEGLESYVPRMVVQMTISGPKVIKSATAKQAARGGNLSTTTGQLRQRKYETVEETQEAAQKAFGRGANVVRDIRTLGLATQRLEQAIAGRTLVDKIKAMSKDAGGGDLVTEGANPDPGAYFTLDHPALRTWGPKFVVNAETGKFEPVRDQNGDMQFEAQPVWVSNEFKGPLNAVLSAPSTGLTRALMDLKGKMMSVIMYSPLMHNAVIWGKAIPADPRGVLTFGAYVRGNLARKTPDIMNEAIGAGMDPIGHRYFNQDIAGIAAAEGQDIVPGRSWTSQVIGAIPGFFDKDAGEATKRAIDKFGDLWHNTFLWDRVADLQAGLYVHIRDQQLAHGLDPLTAQRMAAHFANRYAGALPMESMSKMARTTANLLLFSRSFTLGNLAVYKDIAMGLPSDVRAQIEQEGGLPQLEQVQGAARQKAIGLLVMDVVLQKIGLSLAAAAAAGIAGTAIQWPWQNEAGKQDKFLIGYEPDGTAIYGRLPTGKVAEDMMGWIGEPREKLLAKLSPYARLMYAMASNDKGFGQHLYDPYDKTPLSLAKNTGRVLWFGLEGLAPTQQLAGATNLVTGHQDPKSAALQAFLPMTGITVAHGAPGGPAMSDMFAVRDEAQFKWQEQRPAIVAQIKAGDIEGARQAMTALGVSPGLQSYQIRVALNPAARMSARQVMDFYRSATPEQKAAFEADRQGMAQRALAQSGSSP